MRGMSLDTTTFGRIPSNAQNSTQYHITTESAGDSKPFAGSAKAVNGSLLIQDNERLTQHFTMILSR